MPITKIAKIALRIMFFQTIIAWKLTMIPIAKLRRSAQ